MKSAYAIAAACIFLSGCGLLNRQPVIKSGEITVRGPADAGKPATLTTSNTGTTVPLPEGSVIVVTETAAQPAQPATSTEPAVPAKPAVTVTEIIPGGPTEVRKIESTVKADTGTVDTSVRQHQIDVAERRWLLWTAIGCGIVGIVVRSMLPAWPALSNGLLAAAALAGLSWKLADVPSWIWLAALLVVGLLVLGYKRAEWDANKDGIPDILQK